MSNFIRSELHVAQQSRRDKLRVQQYAITQHHLVDQMEAEEYCGNENLQQFSADQQGLVSNPDLMQQLRSCRYGNISYDPSLFTDSHAVLGPSLQSDKGVAPQEGEDEDSLTNMPHAIPISSSPYSFSAKGSGDPENCGHWKSVGSLQNCDWNIASYASGSAGMASNTKQLFLGVDLSGGMKLMNNSSVSTVDLNSGYYVPPEVHLAMKNSSGENSNLKHYGDVQFHSPSLYQNTLQDVVCSARVGNQDGKLLSFVQQNLRETGRGDAWMDPGNELVLLPTNADRSTQVQLSSSDLVGSSLEGCHQWTGQLDYTANKISNQDLRVIGSDSCSYQALSLSLSSVPPSRMHVDQAPERNIIVEHVHPRGGCFSDKADANAPKAADKSFRPNSKHSDMSNSLYDVVETPSFNHRNVGPLGPFTGYATILGSSKFLRPAQQLLEDICNVVDPKPLRSYPGSGKSIMDFCVSIDNVNAKEQPVRASAGDSGGSSSSIYSVNEKCQEAGGLYNSNNSIMPEYLQKKEKLLYMHEEVCRRYKQHHQQMQMVVSSFESVAGLSTATPYISLALKTINRHFRFLKSSISDQIRNIKKAVGEDMSSPSQGTSNCKTDTSTLKLKLIDQAIYKQVISGGSAGLFQRQQHVWRPQRGLPERAVAILRAWLFDHFLHPYPTDTDKHMLATQTGLTRNQVSNWFINARVRVWKPMVEEIHMLEAKGLGEGLNAAGKTDGDTRPADCIRGTTDSQQFASSSMPDDRVECFGNAADPGSSVGNRLLSHDMWNQEKRSRTDYPAGASMDGFGLTPCHRAGIEIGGFGAVSLTLGLRQSAEAAQQQQQQQQQSESQIMQHFGGQMIHEFLG